MKLRYPLGALLLVSIIFGAVSCTTGGSKFKAPRDLTPQATYTETRVGSADVFRIMWDDGRECTMTYVKGSNQPMMLCNWEAKKQMLAKL